MPGVNSRGVTALKAPKVDVVIVNWNAGSLLSEAVAPLARHDPATTCCVNVVVVDNASSDGSEKEVEAVFPSITVIRNGTNQGFARACNQGAQQGNAKYILFLNPDATLKLGQLEEMIEFMERQGSRNIAVLGPQVRNAMGHVERTCAREPDLRHLLCRALSLHRVLPAKFADFTMREFDHLSSRPVDQVIGACILTRRAEFEALGGFDERFFVYFEEVDYCRRIRERGRIVYFRSESVVTHVGSATTNRVKGFRLYLSLRSRITYAHKWFGRSAGAIVDLTSLFIEPLIRTLHALACGSPKGAREVLEGARRLLRWRAQSGLTPRLRFRGVGERVIDLGPV